MSGIRIKVEITEAQLKAMVLKKLREELPEAKLDERALKIEVKSKQNYKSEWESADFRATYEGEV